jgi:cysteine-rich repeat protein
MQVTVSDPVAFANNPATAPAVHAHLATTLGVPYAYINVNVRALVRRLAFENGVRRLANGNVAVENTVSIPIDSIHTPDDIVAAMANLDPAALGAAVGSALGIGVQVEAIEPPTVQRPLQAYSCRAHAACTIAHTSASVGDQLVDRLVAKSGSCSNNTALGGFPAGIPFDPITISFAVVEAVPGNYSLCVCSAAEACVAGANFTQLVGSIEIVYGTYGPTVSPSLAPTVPPIASPSPTDVTIISNTVSMTADDPVAIADDPATVVAMQSSLATWLRLPNAYIGEVNVHTLGNKIAVDFIVSVPTGSTFTPNSIVSAMLNSDTAALGLAVGSALGIEDITVDPLEPPIVRAPLQANSCRMCDTCIINYSSASASVRLMAKSGDCSRHDSTAVVGFPVGAPIDRTRIGFVVLAAMAGNYSLCLCSAGEACVVGANFSQLVGAMEVVNATCAPTVSPSRTPTLQPTPPPTIIPAGASAAPSASPTEAPTGRCGDGVLLYPEVCEARLDNEFGVSGLPDGCTACQIENGWQLFGAWPGEIVPVCGDTLTVGTELCDDGNSDSGDGCDSTCKVEEGYICAFSQVLKRSFCSTACGDFNRIGNEACDDGNEVSGDGCDHQCQLESGYTCERQITGLGVEGDICKVGCNGSVDLVALGFLACSAGSQADDAVPVSCFPQTCGGDDGWKPPILGCPEALMEYAGLTLLCEEVSTPIASTAVWNAFGTVVGITFSMPVTWASARRLQLEEGGSCSDIFEDAVSLLGDGATCRIADSALEMIVALGSQAMLRPEAELWLHGGKLKLKQAPWPSRWPPLTVAHQAVVTLPPADGFAPPVAAFDTLEQWGSGGQLMLDGRQTQGGGSVGLDYEWSVDSVSMVSEWLPFLQGGLASAEEQVKVLLQTALQNTQNAPVAKFEASVLADVGSALVRPGVQPPLGISVKFSLQVKSRLSGTVSATSGAVNVQPFLAVPQLVPASSQTQAVLRSRPVELNVLVQAPPGMAVENLPSYSLSWSAKWISSVDGTADGTSFSVADYKAKNPGKLSIPALSMEAGTVEFKLTCTYGPTDAKLSMLFTVTFKQIVPIAILEGAASVGAACGAHYSAATSYDPSHVRVDGSPMTPLQRGEYVFEWKCAILGVGPSFMELTDHGVIIANLVRGSDNAESCLPTVNKTHAELQIPRVAFVSNTLILVSVRVYALVSGTRSSWVNKLIRLVATATPAVKFPLLPMSPARASIDNDLYGVVVRGAGCGGSGNATTEAALRTSDGESAMPLRILETFQSIGEVPSEVKTLTNLGDVGPEREVTVYWMRINAGSMLAGGRYRVELRSEGWSSTSTVFGTNLGPVAGKTRVEPSAGNAVETTFTLTAEWIDDDGPLTYAFWKCLDGEVTEEILIDYSALDSVSRQMVPGSWNISSSARDNYGAVSGIAAHAPHLVSVKVVEITTASAEKALATMAERCSEPSQLVGAIEAMLSVPIVNDTAGNNTNQSAAATGYSTLLTNSMLDCLGNAQAMIDGNLNKGSKDGSMQQAAMLGKIVNLGNKTAEVQAKATNLLANSVAALQNAEDKANPTGITSADCATIANVVSDLLPSDFSFGRSGGGGRRLLAAAEANQIGGIVSGVGTLLAQGAVSNAATDAGDNFSTGALAPVVTPGVSIGAAVMKAGVGANGEAIPTAIDIPGIGTFSVPSEALQQTAKKQKALGFKGAVPAGASTSKFGGNLYGPAGQVRSDTSSCTGADNSSGNTLCNVPAPSPAEGGVLSLGLSSSDGAGVPIEDLREPIIIVVPIDPPKVWTSFDDQLQKNMLPACKFWLEAEETWGGDGCKVQAVAQNGSQMRCACTHLTAFSSFSEQAEDVVGNSNYDVLTDFSYEGLRADNPTLWFVVGLVIVQILWILVALRSDCVSNVRLDAATLIKLHFKDEMPVKPKDSKQSFVMKIKARFKNLRRASNSKEGSFDNSHDSSTGSRQLSMRKRGNSPDSHESPTGAPRARMARRGGMSLGGMEKGDRLTPKQRATAELKQFRNILLLVRRYRGFSWWDMRNHIIGRQVRKSIIEEVKQVMLIHQREFNRRAAELGAPPLQVQTIFRDELLLPKLEARYRSMADIQLMKHSPQLPGLPWSCTGYVKVSPSSSRGTEHLPARIEMRKDRFAIHLVSEEEANKNCVGDPPRGCAGQDPKPWMEASYDAVSDYSPLLESDFTEYDSVERHAEALEVCFERLVARQTCDQADASSRAAELCEEWESNLLSSQWKHEGRSVQHSDQLDFQGGASEDGLQVWERQVQERHKVHLSVDGPLQSLGDVFDDQRGGGKSLSCWANVSVRSEHGATQKFVKLCQRPGVKNGVSLRIDPQGRRGGAIDEMEWVNQAPDFNWEDLADVQKRTSAHLVVEDAVSLDVLFCGLGPKALVTLCGFLRTCGVNDRIQGMSREPANKTRYSNKGMSGERANKMRYKHSDKVYAGWASDFASAVKNSIDNVNNHIRVLGSSDQEKDEIDLHFDSKIVEHEAIGIEHRFSPSSQSVALQLGDSNTGWSDDPLKYSLDRSWDASIALLPENEEHRPSDLAWIRVRVHLVGSRLRFEPDVSDSSPAAARASIALRGLGFLVSNVVFRAVVGNSSGSNTRRQDDTQYSDIDMESPQHACLQATAARDAAMIVTLAQPDTGGLLNNIQLLLGEPHWNDRQERRFQPLVVPHMIRTIRMLQLESRLLKAVSDHLGRDAVMSRQSNEWSHTLAHFGESFDLRHDSQQESFVKKVKWGTTEDEMERYVDFQFRRFDFMLWAPTGLFSRVYIKEHPVSKIFLSSIQFTALERVFMYSCSVVGSLVAAALLFDNGAGAISAPLPTNSTNSSGNGTDDGPWWLQFQQNSDGELVDNRHLIATTTAAPIDPFSMDKIMRQIIVSGISMILGVLPTILTMMFFRRPMYKVVMDEEQKLRIVRRWKIKRWCGVAWSSCWLSFCFFFLWQFAMSKPMDVQQDFTVAAVLNLMVKFILKPLFMILAISGVLEAVRASTLLDSVIDLIPKGFFNFVMFTSLDGEDMAMQQAAALGVGDDADAAMATDLLMM